MWDRVEHILVGLAIGGIYYLVIKYVPFYMAIAICASFTNYVIEFREGQAKGWYYKDYRGKYWGWENLKFAFARTVNRPYMYIGIHETVPVKDSDARDTAFDTWLPIAVILIVGGILQWTVG